MSKGTKLLMEYLEEGTVKLINNNIPTRFDPCTKKGSVLDLCITSTNIDKCITGFEVDTERSMTPFSITKTKNNLITKYTDHNAIMIKVKLPMMCKKRIKKQPMINFNNSEGWAQYIIMSNRKAREMEELIESENDIQALERKIQILDLEIQARSFGIVWRTPGMGKKTKKRENRELNVLYKEQQDELEELIRQGLIGNDMNQKIYKMKTALQGSKIQPQEATAINNPVTGELITDENEIKEVSLEHNVRILTKDKPRPEDEVDIAENKKVHEEIMRETNKDAWSLDNETWITVTQKIKEKNKNVYKMFNKAGNEYKRAIYKYMNKIIETEEIPREFTKTTLIQLWKKKGSALDLNMMRFLHMRPWKSKLLESLVTQKMKSKIVEATPKIQLGGMPGASSVEHLVTLKTWMKMKEETKKSGIFSVYDMAKFFDKESLLDCMTTLNKSAKVDHKSYRIWYNLNANTRITVKTSVGDSAEKSLVDSIGQGSAGAALVSSLNIGCAIEKTFKYIYTARIGTQRLNSLVFQDDISKMNDNVEQAREGTKKIDTTLRKKLLSANYDKSRYLIIGDNRFRKKTLKKLEKNPIMMGGIIIKHSQKEKYLGDIIHEKGCKESIQETINERIRKLISKSEEIIQLADTPMMSGFGHSKVAFNLFEAQIIPCLLHNAESWIGITNKQIKQLQEFQDIFVRKVLRIAPSTTKALINWDIGLQSMKWRIASKKLQFVRKIMLKDNSNITKNVLINEMIENIQGLAHECMSFTHSMGMENIMLYQYSKKDIKEAIKEEIKKEYLTEMQKKEKVSDRLSDDPEENSYINSMSLSKVRVWIRYRARAIAGIKGNFRKSHVNNMGCRFCSDMSDETQEHLELCDGTLFERRGLDLSDWRGKLEFWRRMTKKMATVT